MQLDDTTETRLIYAVMLDYPTKSDFQPMLHPTDNHRLKCMQTQLKRTFNGSEHRSSVDAIGRLIAMLREPEPPLINEGH